MREDEYRIDTPITLDDVCRILVQASAQIMRDHPKPSRPLVEMVGMIAFATFVLSRLPDESFVILFEQFTEEADQHLSQEWSRPT